MRSKKSKGFSSRNRKFKRFLRRKTGDLQKKGLHPKNVTKSGVSPQKTLIWTSICAPEAPSLLISSGHSPRLSSQLRGHGPGMLPVAPGLIITSCASRLNIAIKSRKQPRNTVTAQDRKTYWKGIISNIANKKAAKLIKQSRLHQSTPNNHNKSIRNY